MKKLVKSLSVFVVLFVLAFVVVANVKAAPVLSVEEGAYLRTTGEKQGIRFTAEVDTLEGVTERGFLVAKGQYTAEEMKTKGTKFVVTGTTNNKFSAVIYGIPEASYTQDLTVVPYYVTDAEPVYAAASVTRNLAEVAVSAKNSIADSELINNVTNYVSANYKKAGWNDEGNYEVSGMFETNVDYLREEFIKDLNAAYDTTLTTTSTAGNYTSVLGTDSSNSELRDDLSESLIYKFFAENKETSAKWRWVIQFISDKAGSAVHAKNQAFAILNEKPVYDADVHSYPLHWGRHICNAVYNFFNRASENGFPTATFGDASKYDGIENVSTIYADLSKYEVVKIGDQITLPQAKVKEGYDWKGYTADQLYNAEGKYTLTSSNVEFVPTFTPSNYSITYVYEGLEITELADEYTIESAKIVLPEYSLAGYVFEGWYEDDAFTTDPVTELPAGSLGDKVYYAKMTKTNNVSVNVTYDLNGGSWDAATVISQYGESASPKFTVTRYLSNNATGTEVLFYTKDRAVSNYRWWSFVLLKGTSLPGVFEIVGVANGSTAVAGEYDYYITWHDSCSDTASKSALNSIKNNGSTYTGRYITLENLPNEAGSGLQIAGKVFTKAKFTDSISATLIEQTILPVPVKEGYTFTGWLNSVDGQVYTTYPAYEENPGDITYTAQWVANA